MPSFGEMLRQERKARNIRVRDIAESTKISTFYLRDLEANNFSQLPGTVFNKGYVRAYAEFLGIDAGPLISAYEKEVRAQSASPEGQEQVMAPVRSGSRIRSLALVASVTVILALGAVALAGWFQRDDPVGTLPDPRTRQRASVSTVAQPPVEVAEAAGLNSALPALPEEDTTPRQSRLSQAPQQPAPEAPPAPAPTLTEPVAGPASNLSVTEYATGGGIQNHRLLEEGDKFTEGARVYFWTRVVGAEPGQDFRHVWIRDGAVISSIDLKLGSANWRAHTYKTMYPGSAGEWTVEARDGQDRLLARKSFTCLP